MFLLKSWYNVFYWITRGDSVKGFFDTSSTIFTWLCVLSFIGLIIMSIGAAWQVSENRSKDNSQDNVDPDIRSWKIGRKYFTYIFYSTLGLCLITWAGYVFTPTKKEALLILAAGGTMNYLTTDSTARQIPHEMTTFVVTELKSMAKDAKVDLGLSEQKDKILDEAKQMSAEELMGKMKADTNFAKLILDK
jgi:hypothetical protein